MGEKTMKAPQQQQQPQSAHHVLHEDVNLALVPERAKEADNVWGTAAMKHAQLPQYSLANLLLHLKLYRLAQQPSTEKAGQSERQRDKETERQRNRETDTQTHRHTYTGTHRHTRARALCKEYKAK